MSFVVYPAIDVRDGRVVRLRQGDYAQETRYDADVFELAQRYGHEGAAWLHLVDLDAARAGGYTLLPLMRRLSAETSLRVQTGGGVRSADDVQRLLDAGATRVVVGSLAVREPAQVVAWLGRFGADRLTIALDTRRDDASEWRMPLHGWTKASGTTLAQTLAHYAGSGLQHVLCTDIARDGMLAGPNLALYETVRALAPELQVQASGGVRDVGDVGAARDAGCAGVILGRALLEERMTLQSALDITSMNCPSPARGEPSC